MINIPAIQEGLKNLIGFEQNATNAIPQLNPLLLVSESGLKVQKIHPLLTIDNLVNCTKVENIDTYLTDKRSASIANLINRIYTEKQLSETGKELIQDVRLFDGTGNFNDKIVKLSRFVGFRIDMKEVDLSIIMRMIGLQFDTINEALPIYIYHSSQQDYVKKLEINYDKANSFLWKQFDKVDLPFVSGGGYIVGYYEDDITGQSISRDQVFSKMPGCHTCNPVNSGYFQKWFRYLSIRPFYVKSTNINVDKTKWNEGSEVYVDGTNFGLNLSITIVCDTTPLFVRIREVFSHALSLQIAIDLLRDMAYPTLDNRVSQMAMYALSNNENNKGLPSQLDDAVKALNFNISNLNPICLPCADNAQRVQVKSVFSR